MKNGFVLACSLERNPLQLPPPDQHCSLMPSTTSEDLCLSHYLNIPLNSDFIFRILVISRTFDNVMIMTVIVMIKVIREKDSVYKSRIL